MNFEPLTFVLEQLADLLINEFRLLSTDTKEQLQSLQQELQLAQSFLMDLEEVKQRAAVNHVLQTKAQHVMLIVPEIDDFLETFYQDEVQKSHERSCLTRFMACLSCTSNPLIYKHFLIERVTQLKQRLHNTLQSPEGYLLPSNFPPPTYKRWPRTQPHIINDEFIIGLDEDVPTLVAKLVGKEGDHTTTLAIVGMGGSGKTTIARKLYNNKEIIQHFADRAWVCISQEWDSSCLLREICAQLCIQLAEGETSMAIVKLQEFLQRSSCLVVLDDVWEREALQELLPLLSSTPTHGSCRVLITTRNENIVRFPTLGSFHIHKARCLTPEESWKLFSTIIRKNWQGIGGFDDQGDFARLGNEMLNKCNGLPLAIIALAGLLSAKATTQEWESIKNDVISRIMNQDSGYHDYGPVKEMLELSYSDLPYYLKPCFLYLGIFEEDSEIDFEYLTQLWIAEGFIKSNLCNESQTIEEIARDFLDKLVQRCMVQVVRVDYEGKVQSIRIHDLMRDLCIKKAKDLSFFEVSSRSAVSSTSKITMSRRAIIHKGRMLERYNSHLRSFICFDGLGQAKRMLELPYENLKLLRVLDLVDVYLGDSAEQIGNLILLRYLKIEKCLYGAKKLLESLRKLRNLLTFIYVGHYKERLPYNIVSSMKHLRHFSLITFESTNAALLLGVDKSRNLQSLRVEAGEWLIKELLTVSTGLRDLDLRRIHSQGQLEAIYQFVSNRSSHLYGLSLHLIGYSALEFDRHKLKLECFHLLKDLYLSGKMRKQHLPLLFPPKLLRLSLEYSEIEEEEDLEGALSQLGQLRSLHLFKAYKGHKLKMIGLPQLQNLSLSSLSNLTDWRIEEGALLQLEKLFIGGCHQLERIPKRISDIHTLQRFDALGMGRSFGERLQKPSKKVDNGEGSDEGEDYHLIQHISFVRIEYYKDG